MSNEIFIDGDADAIQLRVQAHTTQNNPLQTWEADDATVLAQMTEEGRMQVGDVSLMTTDESLVEAHAEGTGASATQRGLNAFGKFTGALSNGIAWLMSELQLPGSGTISGIHAALRARLTHDNDTEDSSAADLRGGDFEAINQGGDSETPVGKLTGVQGAVDNQANAYLSTARGVAAQIANGSSADIDTAAAFEVLSPVNDGTIDTLIGLEIPDINQGTDNYAIRTAAGKVKLGVLTNGLVKSTDGELANAVQGTDYDTEMQGATGGADGASGSVPQPLIADKDKFLKGDGTWDTPDGGVSTLDDLTDVDTTGVSTNDVLTYDGSDWVPQAPSGGANALDDLTDVDTTGVSTNDVLTYDGSDWVPQAPSGGANALDDLTDVDTTGVSTNDVLTYDGSDWVPQAPSGGGAHTHTVSEITDAGNMAYQDKESVYITGGDIIDVDISVDYMSVDDLEVSWLYLTELQMESDDASSDNRTVANNSAHHSLNVRRARGTIDSPSAIQQWDLLGGLLFRGYDGSNYRNGPQMVGIASANWSGADRDAALDFYVANGTSLYLAARLEDNKALALYDALSTPGSSSDRIKLWSDSGELKVKDGSGNTTTLSSHNPQLVDISDRPTTYVYAESNPFTGHTIEIDVYKMARLLEDLTGEQLIHVAAMAQADRMDWAVNESQAVAERQAEIERWQATPVEERSGEAPTSYSARPEPAEIVAARNWVDSRDPETMAIDQLLARIEALEAQVSRN